MGKKITFDNNINSMHNNGRIYSNINSNNLKSGIYFLKIESNNTIETKKFIVLK
jgi:hypothetical protein